MNMTNKDVEILLANNDNHSAAEFRVKLDNGKNYTIEAMSIIKGVAVDGKDSMLFHGTEIS